MIHIEEGNELHVEHFSLNSILGPPGKNKFQFLTPNEKEWEWCKHYTKRSMGTQFIHFRNGFYTKFYIEYENIGHFTVWLNRQITLFYCFTHMNLLSIEFTF